MAESTSFHVVRLQDGRVCSRRSFSDDFIHLHHNAGASVQGDLVAVLSIRYQVVHLMQVSRGSRGQEHGDGICFSCGMLHAAYCGAR